jgi:hypothetical protein
MIEERIIKRVVGEDGRNMKKLIERQKSTNNANETKSVQNF